MNKIILDNKEFIDLVIEKDSICNIGVDYNISKINIILKDNVSLVINHYSEVEKNVFYLNIKQENNSNFTYNHSFINNNNKYDLNINIDLIGNDSKNIININGISDNGVSNVLVNGSVIKDTTNNELYENIKMLNINEGKSSIVPNMFINTKNVIANHAASITNINKDYLFYLNCKGIKDKECIKLIKNGFLNNEAR